MKLKSYKDLGSVYRNDPCEEHPGTWVVFLNGSEVAMFRDVPNGPSAHAEAIRFARDIVQATDDADQIAVGWSCDENDPRIGEVWFTGFWSEKIS